MCIDSCSNKPDVDKLDSSEDSTKLRPSGNKSGSTKDAKEPTNTRVKGHSEPEKCKNSTKVCWKISIPKSMFSVDLN